MSSQWTPAGARDVVTGEAVALELRLAKLPSRALAIFLDLAAIGALLIVVGIIAGLAAGSVDEALGAAIVLTSFVLVVLGYPILFETLSRGRSPGKAALGLRVVRDDGGPIRFRHALVRALIGLVVDFNPILVGAVGVLVSLGSEKGKRVGDMLAGTVVIRERVPTTYAPPAVMPPQLAGWSGDIAVGRLPDPLALEIRQVLSRLRELDPEIAAALTARLAAEVVALLGTPPPGLVGDVEILSAVLAERRNRELARAGYSPQGYAHGYAQPAYYPQQNGWATPPPMSGPPPPPLARPAAVPPSGPFSAPS